MEESIGKFCTTVAKFCNHLQSNCSALKESADRRPISLDSASATFVESVNRRVSAAGDDLNMLESMSLATVSFEELLGHCHEVLKKNQSETLALVDYLSLSSDYIHQLNFDEEAEDNYPLDNFSVGSSDWKSSDDPEEDPLLDDSLSLRNFGISDVTLATIASQECGQADGKTEMDGHGFMMQGETAHSLNSYEDSPRLINVSQDEYDSRPTYMKGLVSWEAKAQGCIKILEEFLVGFMQELLVAVEKMNSHIKRKVVNQEIFEQDEIESLGLGYKARSYLLLLIKMDKLLVQTNEGVISYKVL